MSWPKGLLSSISERFLAYYLIEYMEHIESIL